MKALTLCLASLTLALHAKETLVSPVNNDTLKSALKDLQAGDTLTLAEGEWPDVQIRLSIEGTEDKPVTIKAATPGKTILTGQSSLHLSGQHVIAEGLWFRDPSQTSGEVIELRTKSNQLAFHCTVRNCAVTSSKPLDLGRKTARFVSLYGSDNVIEHCHLEGKTTGGTTVVVWLTPGGEGRHQIRANYFGPRPALGENGGESIRLGDSATHDQNARCEVIGNLFYQCNGEGEIVSVKSCENKLIGNTFVECEGALTLRHAHRCLVEGNLFCGNHKRLTGGIRIVGEDHVVKNNWIENCDGSGYRAALTFMNGIFNTEDSGYQQVKHVTVESNTVINCKNTLLIGFQHDKKCTAPPLDCVIRGNEFISPKQQLIELVTEAPGWKWENNVLAGKGAGIDGLSVVADATPRKQRPKELTRKEAGVSWAMP